MSVAGSGMKGFNTSANFSEDIFGKGFIRGFAVLDDEIK